MSENKDNKKNPLRKHVNVFHYPYQLIACFGKSKLNIAKKTGTIIARRTLTMWNSIPAKRNMIIK